MQQILSPRRRAGGIAAILISAYLFSGQSAPQGCAKSNQQFNIGPSKGQVIGAAVGVVAVIAVGTVVLVEVHKSHHTVKGCVTSGPDGMEVTTEGDKPKTYRLDGDTASVKPGDLVRFHGDKVKKAKDSTGDQVFRVQKISREYGACKVAPATKA